MIYLVAGLDRITFARWHLHVMAPDACNAARIAGARAAGEGVELVVAAVIGPCSSVVTDEAEPLPAVAPPGYARPEAA